MAVRALDKHLFGHIMYSRLFLLTQVQGLVLVGILTVTSDQQVPWIGVVALSMLVGFGLYGLNVRDGTDSTASLADLCSETMAGVRLWGLFLVVLWVTFMTGLFLSSETW